MIQIASAFELLKKIAPEYLPASLYAIDVSVIEANTNVGSNMVRRGIYIREPHQLGNGNLQQFSDFIVKIEPKFSEDTG